MKQKLEHQVAAAVGAILVGLEMISLDEVQQRLPTHLKAANPTLKSITKAIVSAGWVGRPAGGGTVLYVPEDAEPIAPADHNGSDEGSVAADEIRLLLERAERMEEEKKGIADDIKDTWSEAKSRGYDAAALKSIMKLRGQKKDDVVAKQAIMDTYLRALGMMA